MAELLELRGIRKGFPGVRALDGVDFTVRAGEIHALMGENGAGKSTLIKVLTGVYRPDAGEIRLEGRVIQPRRPAEAAELGISTVYQEVNLIPTLSVAENLLIGRLPRRFGMIDWRRARHLARESLRPLGLDLDVSSALGSHSLAVQQLVAVARALGIRARVLILDEPTSSLDAGEVERLFQVLRELRQRGLGLVFVTHFIDQVYALSDRITILRGGRLEGEFAASELPRVELVTRMMGRELAAFERETHATPGERARPFLRARGVGRPGAIEPFDLDVAAGETLGLAGLLGSGRTELAGLLFGLRRAASGELEVDGRRRKLRGPRDAIRLGFALCPEDRKAQGIFPDLSVRENIILALQARRGWWRPLGRRKEEELARHYIDALGISAASAEQPIGTLSGGNQQKAILARWLAADPRFLILDEPTRGIDVGAKTEIQKLVLKLARQGKSVLFISSELEEVIRCSSRVAVLRDRRKVEELSGTEVEQGRILRAIAAGAPRGAEAPAGARHGEGDRA
jgi:galactofuranose transport system ATP-binding protein